MNRKLNRRQFLCTAAGAAASLAAAGATNATGEASGVAVVVDPGDTVASSGTARWAAEELERWTITTQSPLARLWHFKPVLGLSETPPRWDRPAVPLGYNKPEWPPRPVA